MNTTLHTELYRKVYTVRMAEERIRADYMGDEMKTPVHLSLGEEGLVAGVVHALTATDKVFGTWRNHALYLTKGGSLDDFFCELYGRETGVACGKAGSMHLSSPAHGFLASSAVVGSILPVALGAAYAQKAQATGDIAAVFFGDGATEEGVFWETLNYAALAKLPLLFVCEDNGLAIHSHIQNRQSYDIATTVKTFNLPVFTSDSTDAGEIHELAATAAAAVRRGEGPAFLLLKYLRYLEHVGVNEDFSAGYRCKEDCADWFDRDPVRVQRANALKAGATEAEIAALENGIRAAIEAAVAKATASAFPALDELRKDVYA
ncbi:thiamine pyrophosphate-dependent dehydrogenase E1 component subunit alpha [Pseudodesulfovibrio sp.]|uniref:thiamine pyrophosphate-dependent dehydrogenase E1 component subunit alpha n=1 Tax=Pseudodesulfovibrio sp. TaxID=2035812 RepID=UPI002622514B|nr:thiamine pyrophosphate-dependent dehydrogenase E1 component subunit alpha [Pseudodesulfovibrio sp.]MDD3312163.1 thiamine pyrophosphate-dependent dehydrogenase E1 component subunit alpha [Pseudodesulfovibrio sp.]